MVCLFPPCCTSYVHHQSADVHDAFLIDMKVLNELVIYFREGWDLPPSSELNKQAEINRNVLLINMAENLANKK